MPPAADPGRGFATPSRGGGAIAALLKARRLAWLGAHIGIWFARRLGRPLRLGRLVIVARYKDVRAVLARDLDFRIAPINAAHFDAIGYHFILGMDRSDELRRERQVLYAALASVDFAQHKAKTRLEIAARLERVACGSIDIIEDFARPVAAATAQHLFGIAPVEQARFMDAARAIFGHCFLNPANDPTVAARAKAAAVQLTMWFDSEIARRRAQNTLGSDMMGQLLAAGATDDLARRTLGGMLVGSIDTTASVVAKVMIVFMGDSALRARVSADKHDEVRLYGWCQEALRCWAHVPILGRQAALSTTISGTDVPAGAKVILWTQAAMLDPEGFPNPNAMRPDRPGDSYLHLGAGLHPCAGRTLNAWQIPMLVGALLEHNPRSIGTVRWAGPFPAHVPLRLGPAA